MYFHPIKLIQSNCNHIKINTFMIKIRRFGYPLCATYMYLTIGSDYLT